ncbi:MAG: hypothetical protein RSE13_06510 [Planktothrix sp. GU0601_MAG3]|nr:MAG: hypothetical protein RSE13_06510 [Planktothrix sp. GU0601_MAG3]
MKLHLKQANTETQPQWQPIVGYTSEFNPFTWVQMREKPNPYSHDQALLLCQVTEDEWVAWVSRPR